MLNQSHITSIFILLSFQIQDDAADIHGLTQQCITTVCRRVARAILEKRSDYIKMPTSLNEEINIMQEFEAIAGFKRVVGAIDCTHIRVPKVQGASGQFYIIRKGYTSLNVQVPLFTSYNKSNLLAEPCLLFW